MTSYFYMQSVLNGNFDWYRRVWARYNGIILDISHHVLIIVHSFDKIDVNTICEKNQKVQF